MTKKDMTKFSKLVAKNTQKEAIYNFLNSGREFTTDDAMIAGIKDPGRVVRQLRAEYGLQIYLNERTLRSGEVVKRYRLANTTKS